MPRSDRSTDTDEQSPLIAAQNTDHDADLENPALSETFGLEDSFVKSKSSLYLILLTLCIGGLQIVWSVELSNGSPYLLSLGMSKALLAFVWLAGPLTGVLVQPYIGIVSDRCRISWGKRKPFMIGGTVGTIVSSLLLSYAKDIVGLLGGWETGAKYEGAWKIGTIIFATVMMWALDFCINTVQAAIRAFIVDNAPAQQQDTANAWASRMTGVGNVIGYIAGYLNLPKYFHFFGNTQFKVLCVVASIALASTTLVSITFIKERNPQDEPTSKDDRATGGVFSFFRQVFVSIRRLSPQVRSVCKIQFCHWIGWFPFLFYITTYIGQLYVDPRLRPDMTDEEIDRLWGQATRIGTLALLIYAIISFSANIILPFLIAQTYIPSTFNESEDLVRTITPTTPIGSRPRSQSYSDIAYHRTRSNTSSSKALSDSNDDHVHNDPSNVSARKSSSQSLLRRVQIPGLTLRRAWLLAQVLHALCMFSTFFIHTPTAATVMTSVVGLCWSLTLWAPFALISGDIARRDEIRRRKHRQKLFHEQSTDANDAGNSDITLKKLDEQEDRAGIILGLHNVAVSAPQIVATLISSVVFKYLQKGRGTPGDTSVAWTLRIGGLAALLAAWFTFRMQEPGRYLEEDDAIE